LAEHSATQVQAGWGNRRKPEKSGTTSKRRKPRDEKQSKKNQRRDSRAATAQ